MDKVHKLKDPVFNEFLSEYNLDNLFYEYSSYNNQKLINLSDLSVDDEILDKLHELGVTNLEFIKYEGLEFNCEDGVIIFKFNGIDGYFRITGTYYSHIGAERDFGWKEVFPEEVKIIIYNI